MIVELPNGVQAIWRYTEGCDVLIYPIQDRYALPRLYCSEYAEQVAVLCVDPQDEITDYVQQLVEDDLLEPIETIWIEFTDILQVALFNIEDGEFRDPYYTFVSAGEFRALTGYSPPCVLRGTYAPQAALST